MCCVTNENQLFQYSRLWKLLYVLVNSMRGNQRSNTACDCTFINLVWVIKSKSHENTVISQDGNTLEELQNQSPCLAARTTQLLYETSVDTTLDRTSYKDWFSKKIILIPNCVELLVDILEKSWRSSCMDWELGLCGCWLGHTWLWRSIDTKDESYCTVFDFSVSKNTNIWIFWTTLWGTRWLFCSNGQNEKDSAKIHFNPSNWPLGCDGWTIQAMKTLTNSKLNLFFLDGHPIYPINYTNSNTKVKKKVKLLIQSGSI